MSSNNCITFNTLKPNLMADITSNIVPFLVGEPGIGKSAILKNLAHQLHTRVFILSVNQLGTREDLTGARTIKDNKTETYRQIFFPHASVQDAIDYAKEHPTETPILFLDEINRTSPDVTSATLQLITERRLGTTKLPDNIRIVAAGNDNGNVNALDGASLTRMSIYHVTPDAPSWLEAMKDRLNPYIHDVIEHHPDLLVCKEIQAPTVDDDTDDDDDDDDDSSNAFNELFDDNSFTQMTVPRTLEYASQYLNALGFTHQGDQKERQCFSEYQPSYTDYDNVQNVLSTGLKAHLGDTAFTRALYDDLREQDRIYSRTNNNANNQAYNTSYQYPTIDQDLIQKLANCTSENMLLNVCHQLTNEEIEHLYENLFNPEFVKQLNHNDIVTTLIQDYEKLMPTDAHSNFITHIMVIMNQNELAPIALDENNWEPQDPATEPKKNIIAGIIKAY